jgi:hypothetical protein
MKNENPNRKRVFSAALTAGLLILILGLTYRVLEAKLFTPLSDIPVDPTALDDFPLQIHDWIGQDIPIDEAEIIMDKIRAEACINRCYSCDKSARSVLLFIAASGVTEGTMVGHPPEVCNVFSGYKLIDQNFVELNIGNSLKLPCKILQFEQGGSLGTVKKVVLYYYVADGEFYGDRSQLRVEVRRGPRTVNCIGQVQIAASSKEISNADSLVEIVSDFAVESAPLISDMFKRIGEDQRTASTNVLELQVSRQ